MSRFFLGVQPLLWSKVSAGVFGVLFVGLILWVYMPQRRKLYDEIASLPLGDGD